MLCLFSLHKYCYSTAPILGPGSRHLQVPPVGNIKTKKDKCIKQWFDRHCVSLLLCNCTVLPPGVRVGYCFPTGTSASDYPLPYSDCVFFFFLILQYRKWLTKQLEKESLCLYNILRWRNREKPVLHTHKLHIEIVRQEKWNVTASENKDTRGGKDGHGTWDSWYALALLFHMVNHHGW